MKKKLLIVILSIVLGAGSVTGFIIATQNNSNKSGVDSDILNVYNQYVVHAQEKGSTPLSYEEWLLTIKGENGKDGIDGEDGLSAYQIWLNAGNVGTEQDFLNWLKGSDGTNGTNGTNGLSAYQIWLNAGNIGTEQDFLNWLKGKDGVDATKCEHKFGDYSTLLSSCTTKVKMKTCEYCGVSQVESEFGNWHNYVDTIVEPTCGVQGYTLHYCENCSSNYKDNFVDKTNEHNFVELEVITSTCTELKVLATCSECNFNTVLIDETTVEHDYDEVTYKATCSEQGFTIFTCKMCEYSYVGDYINATDEHKYVDNICTECGCINNEAWDGTIATKIAKGNGSEFNPYLIQTGAELAFIAKQINGSSSNTYYYKHYKLANSIDLGGQEWTPIGSGGNTSFRGIFDGDNFTISNFKITTAKTCVGFFGYCDGAIIKNLNIHDFIIDIQSHYNYFNELGSYNASIGKYVGGIVGNKINGTLDNCNSKGSIILEYTSFGRHQIEELSKNIGGIVGENSGIISNSSTEIEINSISNTNGCYYASSYTYYWSMIINSGSIVGKNNVEGNIINCNGYGNLNNTAINADYSSKVYSGGVVGYNAGNVSFSYSKGYSYSEAVSLDDIFNSFSYAGGFVGYNAGIINNSYSTNYVSSNSTAQDSYAYAGGFVAYNDGEISNCYATGNVSAYLYTDYVYVGGFVGLNKEDATIDNCFRYSEQLFSINQNGIISNTPTNVIGNEATLDNLNSKDFYKIMLLWNEEIWNFDNLFFEEEKYPILK